MLTRTLRWTLVGALSWTVPAPAAPAEASKLIPRAVLFGNPTRTHPQIAPDGTRVSYLAPSDQGVLNVWVRSVDKDDAAMVTADTHRGINNSLWTYDNRIVFLQDVAGEEDAHVYLVDLQTRLVRDLTPFQGVRAQNVLLNRSHPKQMLVGLNLRDRKTFDMVRVDLDTGALVLDTQNPGDVLTWSTDADFQIRAAKAFNPADGSNVLRVRDTRDAAWRDLVVWPFTEGGPFSQNNVVDFTADGKALYVKTSHGADTSRLVKLDAQTGKELEELVRDERVDVGEVLVQPDTHTVQAVALEPLQEEWKILDASIRPDFEALHTAARGQPWIADRDLADRTWIVGYDVDDGPVAYYLYDRASRKARKLFVDRPELEAYTLAPMKPVLITARDGLKLVSYLTLPVGREPKGLPLVLWPHGGPWSRDSWGFSPQAQWLANRGYAVLQVNYRGSTGFGMKFVNAGNGQWGVGAMQQDLTDAVKWAIAEGVADPKHVAVLGGSYGGYATLAGLTFTPELYACGVDMWGISNVKNLLQTMPPYWQPWKKLWILRIGDVEHDEELNRRISPLFHVEAIRAPLLIGQGANDPRVKVAESDQIFAAMRGKGLPVEYVVYADEGHGLMRPENRLDFYGRAEEFLARHLGGAAEPWAEVKGASAQVRQP
jgi:dipeptidyl aminopeptidase/acylaminoacyl peptidase